MSTIGKVFRVTTFGESHCTSVGAVIDGVPPRMRLTPADIQCHLNRRRPGQSCLNTPRDEKDKVKIVSGTENGLTLGTPICCIVDNLDQRPHDYIFDPSSYIFRPSHADYTYHQKYGIHASSGGGRSSARETIGRVIGGAIAMLFLKTTLDIDIIAYVSQVGDIYCELESDELNRLTREDVDQTAIRCPNSQIAEKMESYIGKIKCENDSIGGIVSCICRNIPTGLGEPVFEKMEAILAQCMLSIPATKGFEIGSGFGASRYRGREHNDEFHIKDNRIRTVTNRSGGIQGGITNGEDITFRVSFKPPATISLEQKSVSASHKEVVLTAKGRHDPCIVNRAVPIVEAMAAIALMDAYLLQTGRSVAASTGDLAVQTQSKKLQLVDFGAWKDLLIQKTRHYKYKLLITDSNLVSCYRNDLDDLDIEYIVLPAGETTKKHSNAEYISESALQRGFNRSNSVLVAFGGGVIGDLVGYSASIFMRGIPYIQVPTSLLAMVDSSVGGKVGVDTKYGKNTMGTFHLPLTTIVDVSLLKTLPYDELVSGFSEVLKTALVANKELWELCASNTIEFLQNEESILAYIIKETVLTKLNLCSQDVKDTKLVRECLNFGHTIGHVIEHATYLPHGHAVSIGMLQELRLSTPHSTRMFIKSVMHQYDQYHILPELNIKKILKYLNSDKKDGRLVTLPAIGLPQSVLTNNKTLYGLLTNKRSIRRAKINSKDTIAIKLPASKSITNRAILLAALSKKKYLIHDPLFSEDTILMIRALQQLGVVIKIENDKICVDGCAGVFKKQTTPPKLYLGNSGTCVRFLTAVLGLVYPFEVTIDGNKYMRRRPISQLLNALNNIVPISSDNKLPITIHGDQRQPHIDKVWIESSVSSQYISGLLLALQTSFNYTINLVSSQVPSMSFVSMTIKMMKEFGTNIVQEGSSYFKSISDATINDDNEYINYYIEPDATAAIYPLCAALINQQPINILGLKVDSLQGDLKKLYLLEHFGTEIYFDENGLMSTPKLNDDSMNADCLELDLDSSDTFMTFAALGCFCGPQKIKLRNISNQNLKECARIDSIVEIILCVGHDAKYSISEDCLELIRCTPDRRAIDVDCQSDHRIAMTTAVLALSENCKININDYSCVEKTYPNFWTDYSQYFGCTLSTDLYRVEKSLYFIGLPGSGKSYVAKLLGKTYDDTWLDIDNIIEKNIGESIDQIVHNEGWLRFRQLERKCLLETSAKFVACGGGIVEMNYDILNSKECIWVQRPEHLIIESWKERPNFYASTVQDLQHIKDCRNQLYDQLSLSRLDNNTHGDKDIVNWYSKNYKPDQPKPFSLFCIYTGTENISLLCEEYCEIRADYMCDNIEVLERAVIDINKLGKYIIATIRSDRESGLFNGTQNDKIRLYKQMKKWGAHLFDYEALYDDFVLHEPIILSAHNDDFSHILRKFTKISSTYWANIWMYKIVTCSANRQSVDRFIDACDRPVCVIYYDQPLSRISNIYMTPVCLEHPVYRGQLTRNEVITVRNILNSELYTVQNYYLVGYPIQKSPGPLYHNNRFVQLRTASYYSLYETNDINNLRELLSRQDTCGVSITIPLKAQSAKLCDVIYSKVPGIINTIVKRKDKLVGYNTDAAALAYFLKNIDSNKNIAVIGYGDTATTATCVALELDFNVYVWGRDENKARDFSEKHRVNVLDDDTIYEYGIICIPISANFSLKINKLIDFGYGGQLRPGTWVSGRQLFEKQAELQSKIFCSEI